MWTKILVLLIATTVGSHARSNGYTYTKPANPVDIHFNPIIQPSLSYYANVRANQDYTDFTKRLEQKFGFYSDHSRFNTNHLNHIAPESNQRPLIIPSFSNTYRDMSYGQSHFLPNQVDTIHQNSGINVNSHHQNILSQDIRVSRLVEGHLQNPDPYRIAQPVVSLPKSVNVPLPFPFGVVPIRFKPFPLKTHLPLSNLLPITSYEASESYRRR